MLTVKQSKITFNRNEKIYVCLLKDLTKRNLSPVVTIGVYIDCKKKERQRIRNILILESKYLFIYISIEYCKITSILFLA